jgi:hypothetical protein
MWKPWLPIFPTDAKTLTNTQLPGLPQQSNTSHYYIYTVHVSLMVFCSFGLCNVNSNWKFVRIIKLVNSLNTSTKDNNLCSIRDADLSQFGIFVHCNRTWYIISIIFNQVSPKDWAQTIIFLQWILYIDTSCLSSLIKCPWWNTSFRLLFSFVEQQKHCSTDAKTLTNTQLPGLPQQSNTSHYYIYTVVKELRSKMFGQHSGYFKAVFLKQTRIIIVSIYKYTVYDFLLFPFQLNFCLWMFVLLSDICTLCLSFVVLLSYFLLPVLDAGY